MFDSATSWTGARQAPLCPWGFPGKNNYRVGCHFSLQGNLPDPGIQPESLGGSAVKKIHLPSRRPLEEMATQSSILTWRIPWTEEPGTLTGSLGQRLKFYEGYQKVTVYRVVFENKDPCPS